MSDKVETNSAIQKALSVMEAITKNGRPLSIADISHELELPRQTIHRTVQQLEALGLLQKDPHRERFGVGPRLKTLAINTVSAGNATGTRAILQDLVGEINETCNVGILDDHEVLYIDRVECDWPLRVQLQAGSRVPVHCTAIGKLLLAHQEEDAQQRILKTADLRRYTKHTITDPGVLEAQLAQIVAQGYSINNQEDAIGLIALAVPVRNADGLVIAGLGVHAPEPRFNIKQALDRLATLRAAAGRLQTVLSDPA